MGRKEIILDSGVRRASGGLCSQWGSQQMCKPRRESWAPSAWRAGESCLVSRVSWAFREVGEDEHAGG